MNILWLCRHPFRVTARLTALLFFTYAYSNSPALKQQWKKMQEAYAKMSQEFDPQM